MNRAPQLDELPYRIDSCTLFDCIRDLPRAAFLDSSYPQSGGGRYDILTACPVDDGPAPLTSSADEAECQNYFSDLIRFHRERYGGNRPASPDIPFSGGLLGYLGYDCALGLHRARRIETATPEPTGGGDLRAYDWCVIQDHTLERAVLVAQPHVTASVRRDLLRRLREPSHQSERPFSLREPFSSNMTADQYRHAFQRIAAYIEAGDCYQVNLAQRFSARCQGDPWQAYLALRGVAAAPFSGFIDLGGDDAILCLSPERFLSLHGRRVETMPIKGTRPRHQAPEADKLAAEELHHSPKDRAENLMIVDLLRNDLGRSCVPGSIRVDRLFELQTFATVHHLVSAISGELRSDLTGLQLLRDSFPGGSITGAPKRRAMEIIAELEPDPRQSYCGSLLYLSADGRMDSNIAIRTFVSDSGVMRGWAGGGIVADSRWEQEYQETFDKIGSLLRLLEALQPL